MFTGVETRAGMGDTVVGKDSRATTRNPHYCNHYTP